MTKNDHGNRPPAKRRSDGSSQRRDDRRDGSDKRSGSGAGRPSGRPSGRQDDRSSGGREGGQRPRRDDDRRPGRSDDRSSGGREGGQRPRRDDDRRPGRPEGPRGERRDDSRRHDRPQGGHGERHGRDAGQGFERREERKPESDRRPRGDAERPERDSSQRPSPAAPVELPEDILPGRKPVRELIEQSPQSVDDVILRQGLRGADVDAVVAACTAAGVRYRFMPAGDMDRIYPGNHQGFLARLAAGELASLDDVLAATKDAPLPVALALDRVQDPGNVGTLARTLFALGGGGIIVPKHEGARLGPGAAKASAGTLSRLPVAKVSNLSRALDEAAEAGFVILGAAGEESAQSVHDLKPDFPVILVLGSEEEGIRQGVRKRCQGLVRIPQARPLDSINVAQAGAIILGRLASLLQQGK